MFEQSILAPPRGRATRYRGAAWPSLRPPGSWLALAGLLATLGGPRVAGARPSGPATVCQVYPESPSCVGRLVTCEACHTSTDPPQWNAYGAAVASALDGRDFDSFLAPALAAIEDDDSDGDTQTNLDELLVGTNPGRAESMWQPPPAPEDGDNPWYAVGEYDPVLAYRRVMVLYCGRSPRFESLRALRELPPQDQRERVHETLSMCLDAEYWRTEGLAALADPRIKPVESLGPDTMVQLGPARGVLADYRWDYRLWRYVLSDDRDMRELLTAQYHVADDGAGGLRRVEGMLEPDIDIGPLMSGGQPLAAEHRAGMITTQWFLSTNTMFSALPRTTAAQAYRAYLGMDISMNEGIVPIDGEPLDIDDKGVTAPACAQCHSTLDPLAYAFSYYSGLEDPLPSTNGTYMAARPSSMMASWDADAPQSFVLGQPVSSVVEWAAVASSSIYFRRAMVHMLLTHALGRAPGPGEHAETLPLLQTLEPDGYSANRLIHRIVDTHAFGVP